MTGSGGSERSVTRLNSHSLLDRPLYVPFCRCLDRFSILFPEATLQEFDLLPEGVERRKKPVSMGLYLSLQLFRL